MNEPPENLTSICKNKPHFVVSAICLDKNRYGATCEYKWIGTVLKATSLFHLTCPKCKSQNSFASVLPEEYLDKSKDRLEGGKLLKLPTQLQKK